MKFVAEDGKMFDTMEECRAYEESVAQVLAFDRYARPTEDLAKARYIYASKDNMAAARKELGAAAKGEGWYIYNHISSNWQSVQAYDAYTRRYAEVVEELTDGLRVLTKIVDSMNV